MLRGSMVHAGVAAHYRGGDVAQAVTQVAAEYSRGLVQGKVADALTLMGQVKKLEGAALSMVQRYLPLYGTGTPLLVETTITKVEGPRLLGGTPDAIVLDAAGRKVLKELKTSDYGDLQAYNITGQADYYAYLAGDIALINIDVITPNLVTQLERPPRADRGSYLYNQLALLAVKYEQEAMFALNSPHYSWKCARCPFFEACKTYDMGGDQEDLLAQTHCLEA